MSGFIAVGNPQSGANYRGRQPVEIFSNKENVLVLPRTGDAPGDPILDHRHSNLAELAKIISAGSGRIITTAERTRWNSLGSPYDFVGSIATAADFPTTAAVSNGTSYLVTANVTDNDATKTNTGQSFTAGNTITWNGTNWTNLGSSSVSSVNTQTGSVVLDTDDIDEGTNNLYFTVERVNNAISTSLGNYARKDQQNSFEHRQTIVTADDSKIVLKDAASGDGTNYIEFQAGDGTAQGKLGIQNNTLSFQDSNGVDQVVYHSGNVNNSSSDFSARDFIAGRRIITPALRLGIPHNDGDFLTIDANGNLMSVPPQPVDLSAYSTTVQLNTSNHLTNVVYKDNSDFTANTSARHSHSNLTQLNSITSQLISNWNTAFGWGDHSTRNYVVSNTTPDLTQVRLANNATENAHAVRLDQMNSAILGLHWQPPVEDILNTPVASPVNNSRYIVGTSPTGAFTGQANKIATWNGSSYDFTTPSEGWTAWVRDVDTNYNYNGTTWVEFGSSVTHNNSMGLQGGQQDQYYHLTQAQHTALTALDISNIAFRNQANSFSENITIENESAALNLRDSDTSGFGISTFVSFQDSNGTQRGIFGFATNDSGIRTIHSGSNGFIASRIGDFDILNVNNSGIQVRGNLQLNQTGSFGLGRLYRSSESGTVLTGGAGTAYDFVFQNSDDETAFRVATGSQRVDFLDGVDVTGRTNTDTLGINRAGGGATAIFSWAQADDTPNVDTGFRFGGSVFSNGDFNATFSSTGTNVGDGPTLNLINPNGVLGNHRSIRFRGEGSSDIMGAISVTNESSNTTGSIGSMRFYTKPTITGVLTERMRIATNGEVIFLNGVHLQEQQLIRLREHNTFRTGLFYDTIGNEGVGLAFMSTNSVFRMYFGTNPNTLTGGSVVNNLGTFNFSNTGLSVAGTVTANNVFNQSTQSLTGTTVTMNCSNGVNGNITLTGNTTITLSNLVAGMQGNLRVVQDSTGSRTLTLSPIPRVINGGSGSIALSNDPSTVDIVSWWYDGTNINVNFGKNYS